MTDNWKRVVRKLLYSNPITGRVCRLRSKMLERRRLVLPIKHTRKHYPNTVFLVLTPEHGNIGDHAITIAQQRLLEQESICHHELTHEMLLRLQRLDRLNCLNGATVMVCGGGNLGTLWFNVETLFRDIIVANPKSKIILMPNTFFYEDTEWGREELEKSIGIYNAHPNLHLFAREAVSYAAMKDIYRNVEAVSDMVLSLHFPDQGHARDGCLLCFRSDHERTMSPEEEEATIKTAEKLFPASVQRTDMIEGDRITVSEREAAVMSKIEQFQKAELVITDRLHAMIFCAISETPCVVVNSKSPKLRGTYEKLKHLPYIRFAESVEELEARALEVTSAPQRQYDRTPFIAEYEKIKRLL